MNNTRLQIINKLINSVNLKTINYNLIKKNAKFLLNLHQQIKPFWANIGTTSLILKKTDKDYNKIFNIVEQSLIGNYECILNELNKIKNIVHLNDLNIDFYYLDIGNYDADKEMINLLFNQSVCLSKFCKIYGIDKKIIIIWIPINSNRDFDYDKINSGNLKKSIDNFKAFTASGVTFGNSPRITIVSRYEEISKLLIHELIHNFNLDGSAFHSHNHNLIEKYKIIKNPTTTKSNFDNYDYTYSIYESYTELLSSYLSMVFRNISLSQKRELLNRFKTEILMETLYSYNVICNLIKLNEYNSFEDFDLEKKFRGDICMYEYYFLKGLLYNNYELKMCYDKNDFLDNYETIINVNKNDILLKEVYENMVEHNNFKYIFYE